MKRTKIIILLFVFLSFMVSAALMAAPEEKVEKTFSKKDEIRFKLVLGDCQLKKSSDGRIHVHLVYSYEPDMSYEPRIKERGDTIYLEEKMRGNNPKGYSTWTVEVPDDIEIDFKSATGNLAVEGVKIEVDGNTGTGNIELNQVKGEYDVSTGTGNIEVYESQGEFDVSSGTGRVKIKNSKGYFEFTCHARRGRIVCPVKFDKEEELKENGQTYLRKSFTKGKDVPKIYIKTGTGKAELNK
jgi:hypothetical protein